MENENFSTKVSQFADLAENYQADIPYSPGQVLMFGGSQEVTIAAPDTTKVAGVVSTNPAHLMNGQLTGSNVVAVALQGRVPCRIIGTIGKGDLVTSSNVPGVATRLDPKDWVPGCVIGKSLEEITGFEITGFDGGIFTLGKPVTVSISSSGSTSSTGLNSSESSPGV